ncbi:MAG: hypothetical protein IT371_08415 [Deltaproteobacteria bacterium]|nr:hypothetical protein [Deltaproteobacteria bacterium]
MALDLTPLEPELLNAGLLRVVGPAAPAPAKMMAAKGLAPLGPKDLAVALYQLSRDADAKIAQAAAATADGLPENILAAALGEALDPRVLDFFATRVSRRPVLAERVLLNRAVHDETLVTLAGTMQERELEILAGNQERILRCPAIVEAVYFNKSARMSTVDRLLELAVRHGLVLPRVPHYKELAASILGHALPTAGTAAAATEEGEEELLELPPEDLAASFGAPSSMDEDAMDALFSSAFEEGFEGGAVGNLEYEGEAQVDEKGKKLSDLPINAKIRLATIGSQSHRAVFIRDSNKLVSMAAIQSPAVNEQEAGRYASNRGLSEEVIRYIATRKEWQKSYQIKLALANNPKCPLGHALRILPHLRPADLRTLSRSKNIPAVLAKAAKELASRRS